MSAGAALNGIVVIDKPAELTSFAVVKQLRRLLCVAKAGHTGTLDPLATGVLPICLGEATKIAGLLVADDKEYLATARLGIRTDTLDREGRVLEERDHHGVTREQIEAALAAMVGPQLQAPPAFSAVRLGGERAYERARRGETVELPPRPVTVHRLILTSFTAPELTLQIACSKGTFVRTICAELGERLGCGAMLTELRRLRSGAFEVMQAVPLQEVEERHRCGELPVIAIDAALSHLDAVEISPEDVPRLRQGQPVAGTPTEAGSGLVRLRCQTTLLALGEQRDGRYWPKRLFHCGY